MVERVKVEPFGGILEQYVRRYPQLANLDLHILSVFDQKTDEFQRYLPIDYAQMSTLSDVFAQVVDDYVCDAQDIPYDSIRDMPIASLWRGGRFLSHAFEERFPSKTEPFSSHYSIRSKRYSFEEAGMDMRLYIPEDFVDMVNRKAGEAYVLTLDDVFDKGISIADNFYPGLREKVGENFPHMLTTTLFYKPENNRTSLSPDVYLAHVPGDVWIVYPHELVSVPEKIKDLKSTELIKLVKGQRISDALLANAEFSGKSVDPAEYFISDAFLLGNRLLDYLKEHNIQPPLSPKDEQTDKFYVIGTNKGGLPAMVVQELLSYRGYKNYHMGIFEGDERSGFQSGIQEVIRKINSRGYDPKVRVFVFTDMYLFNSDQYTSVLGPLMNSTGRNLTVEQIVPVAMTPQADYRLDKLPSNVICVEQKL